jgi:hypothetical protein
MKKSIAALALAGTIALTGTAPAMAANYPAPGTGTGTVSDGTVTPGEVFTFSGTGFLAGETITITGSPLLSLRRRWVAASRAVLPCQFRPKSMCWLLRRPSLQRSR